ncbi:hypothetical protein BDV35DRAFT_359768 [Aspergillus flavus]|uniref:Uncharacterized protein n=3 Tax=cellular organisms TaxID=131567 RepID=A0A1S9DWP1_ASPOZ|nr:hypothetical protein BDV35DRAFT_359768 [Aspergillus flavus]KAJ1711441.1 hypothetical protein NYO67_6418 [Aspergillus flavus]OOO13485.1 hypothetical protein OAory_01012340 [Aspergillus oryzae]
MVSFKYLGATAAYILVLASQITTALPVEDIEPTPDVEVGATPAIKAPAVKCLGYRNEHDCQQDLGFACGQQCAWQERMATLCLTNCFANAATACGQACK